MIHKSHNSQETLPERYIFGIDLGTTNSVISYLDVNLMIQTCRNPEGSDITPSVVDLSDVYPIVGQTAKDNKVFYPHSVLDYFKYEMGQGHAVKYYGENFDKEITAIDLSAEVLKYLRNYASEQTDTKVSSAVITVPAHFDNAEKMATLEAAEKAGFERVWLIEEPVAAAVYYDYKGNKKETVLVYDLGGATFDVSAVEIDGYHYDCFLSHGDTLHGGKDWNFRMQKIIMRRLADAGIDEEDLDDEDMAMIQFRAEIAKKALTSRTTTDVIMRLNAGKAQFEITRQEFEEETKSLLDRTIAITRSVKEKAEVKGKKISKILLVGGSSYMPQVQERLANEFPDVEVPNPTDPNMAVSRGAAFAAKNPFILETCLAKRVAENNPKYFFGIDLGTTNSVISYVDRDGRIQICRNEGGSDITPSVVDLSDVNPLVGQTAKDNMVFYPHSVLSNFKQEMGQGHAVKYYGENFDKETTAIDLSAEVLKYLGKYASSATGSEVSYAVITVPAHFGLEKRDATREAAKKAGLKKVWLIDEPVAAAIYYAHQNKKYQQTILVYDLGGSTFDAVVVDTSDRFPAFDGCFGPHIGSKWDYKSLCGAGENFGSYLWSIKLQAIIMKKLADAGIDGSELDDEDLDEIEFEVEKAKKALTYQTTTNVRLRLNAGKVQFEVTRQKFEEETKYLLDHTIELTRKAMRKAEGMHKEVTGILMVGGGSCMPQVRERLTAEFPDIEIFNEIDPQRAVSSGAALACLKTELFEDKSNYSIGPGYKKKAKVIKKKRSAIERNRIKGVN